MEAAVLIGLVFLLVTFVLPIASWLSSRRTRARVDAMYEALVGEARAVELLKEQVAELREKLRLLERPAPIAAEPPAQPFVVKPAPPPPPAVVKPPEPVPTAPPTPVAPPIPPTPPAPAALPPAPTPRPPSPPPLPPVPVEEPSGWLGAGFDWENLVGVKLFSAIAGIALVFAAVFFLRYSMEHGWLQPPVRVLIGIMVAVGLLVACEMKAARKYPVTANALDAAAIAILFSTFFAAHALWNLIPTSIAFGLLAMVTALAVLLSIRHESLFIALLGLLGGFATPALLSTGENRPIPLFAYLLLLNIGLAWVAHRRTWPVLSVLTLVFTTIYQWGWVIRFLRDASDVSLAMGIFLIFPLVTVAGVLLARRPTLDEAAGDADTTFERTALVAAAVPLVFGVYLAAVPAYGARASLLFGFVFLLDAGLFAIAVARRQMFLHSVAAGTTLITMAIWLAVSYVSDARVVTLAFTAGFVLFFLLAPIAVEAGFSRPVDATVEDGFRRPAGKLAEYTAPLLLFVLAALARLEPAFVTPWLLFATLLVLLLACAWRAIATQDGYIYYIAAFLAVAAQALWSVEHLALERLAAAVSIFATFGIASMAIPLTARRLGRPLQPAEGGGLVLLASLILLLYLSSGPIAPAALWALALLLAILNAGLFVESAGARMPALSIAGSLLSWMILGVWWMRAAGSVGVLPSLAVLIGLTLLTLAGHAWSYDDDRRVPANSLRSLLASGLWLGLGGHLFLFVLAMNREWALPPWPLFGALAVMTFATSVAAAYSRTPVLHAAGIGAAALVVAAWTAASAAMPWTAIGLAAGAAVSAYALGWIPLFRRSGSSEVASIGAAAALVTGELTAMIAGAAPQQPAVTALVAAHVANVAILLALTWARRWRHVAIVVAVIAYAAVVGWRAPWQHQLALSGALYLTIVAYPVLLGARAKGDRDPYIAAIIASAMFFFAGRAALEAGGYEWMIGALPVAEAVVMAVLLRQLLRMETVAERDLGRLALVAGSALALITIAIPLQLDHQWITIGWALEGAALAWLFTRVPHRGLLYSSLALLGAVFVRLALNPEVYRYEPRGELRVFNWYLYSYLLAAASLLVAARWFSRTDARLLNGRLKAAHLLPAAAVVLLFLLLNIEIADFYATGPEITFRFGAGVSQDLTYTIGWLVFGMLLLAAGIYWRTRPARVTAVALIAVTAFKCFLYDLGSLGGLYRVGSFVGLAVALALVSLALQKYVLARPKETA